MHDHFYIKIKYHLRLFSIFYENRLCHNQLNFPIKIDDRIDNLSGADLKLLFSAFHNEDLSDDYLKECNVERMNGWKDVKKRLLK